MTDGATLKHYFAARGELGDPASVHSELLKNAKQGAPFAEAELEAALAQIGEVDLQLKKART